MKKYILLIAGILILFTSGCSSNRGDPKETAVHVCKALKKLDFEELKKYADEELAKQIELGQKKKEDAQSQINALPEPQRKSVKKIYDNQMSILREKMSMINCENIVIKEGGDKDNKTALIDGKPVKLRFIKGSWRLTK
ncbi:hypothetical protein [Sulfurimonas sp. HSL-1716]|uniref:hypothetical protein n=1 Tax=Hydrocurvibacter sulfurireducens TaxID=3131937 RepID=UPI0031F85BE9